VPAENQLRLLPAPQPLVERLGAAFFRELPRAPGVYRMFDDAGQLIYVGKAKDLRARLASYRRTAGQGRKTVRLIHEARRIEWETCADETSASLRENELIRTLRPRFNRAGVWPRSARFVTVADLDDGFRLALSTDPAGESYGAFRAGVGFALGALGRLLWLAWQRCDDPARLPHALVARESIREFSGCHAEAPGWRPDVRAFLATGSEALVERLVAGVPEPGTAFGRGFVAAQFEVLAEFRRRGPLRNERLKARFAPAAVALAPEQLDDWNILAGPVERVPVFRPGD